MRETKHTPGQWINIAEDESGYPVISGPDDTNIAQILCPLSASKGKDVGELLEEVTANKNLIKAAPDMLAALKACKETLDSEHLHIDGLNEVIAKAEGRAE